MTQPVWAGPGVEPERIACRVSVHVQGRRVDLALPADVPSATLLPPIARLAGLPVGAAGGPELSAWQLVAVGGAPLAPETTLSEAGILTGDALTLESVPATPALPVVTDLIEVVQASVDQSTSLFDLAVARRLLRWAAIAFLLAAVPLLVTTGPSRGPSVFVSWAMTLGLFVAAGLLRNRQARVSCAALGIGHAAVGGMSLASWAGISAAGQLAGGAVAAMVAAATGIVLTGSHRPHPVMTAAGAAALPVLATALLLAAAHPHGGRGVASALSVVVLAVLLVLTALPSLVLRGVPLEPAETSPESTPGVRGRSASAPTSPRVTARAVVRVREQLHVAHQTLEAILVGLASSTAVGFVAIVVTGHGALADLLVLAAAGVLTLRARIFRLTAEVLPPVLAGAIGLITVEASVAATVDRPVLRFGLFAMTSVILLAAIRAPDRASYRTERFLDFLEISLFAAAVVLLLGLSGALWAIENFAAGFGGN